MAFFFKLSTVNILGLHLSSLIQHGRLIYLIIVNDKWCTRTRRCQGRPHSKPFIGILSAIIRLSSTLSQRWVVPACCPTYIFGLWKPASSFFSRNSTGVAYDMSVESVAPDPPVNNPPLRVHDEWPWVTFSRKRFERFVIGQDYPFPCDEFFLVALNTSDRTSFALPTVKPVIFPLFITSKHSPPFSCNIFGFVNSVIGMTPRIGNWRLRG